MPELPEVETIVRDLARLLPGSTLRTVEVLRPDLIEGDTPEGFAARITGKRVRDVTRRAKNIVIGLGADRLVVNLGMTGRLLVTAASDADPSHLGVRIGLDRKRELRYHDVRRFGRLWTLTEPEWKDWDEALGVEPLSEAFSAGWLAEAVLRSRVPIKTWLMDQARVVGVGNIYASEALFRAKVDPRRPANTLTRPEAKRLQAGVQSVLRDAIDFRGTTLLDYRDASGEEGAFADRLSVYDRAGQPCVRCKKPVQRLVQAGRSTFFCASCQK